MRDSPLVVITLLWIAALAFIVMRFDATENGVATDSEPTPAATPAVTEPPEPPSLPTFITFGVALDEEGRVPAPQQRVATADGLAYSAWLGMPVQAEEVQLTLIRLGSDGSFDGLWDRVSSPVDPDGLYVSGEVPPDTLADWGPGTYLLRVFRDDEQLAAGAFQIDTAVPESIAIFPERRTASIQPGTHIGYQFDERGDVIGEYSADVDEEMQVEVARRATFGGTLYLLVVDGIEGRYWFPEPDAVVLDDEDD